MRVKASDHVTRLLLSVSADWPCFPYHKTPSHPYELAPHFPCISIDLQADRMHRVKHDPQAPDLGVGPASPRHVNTVLPQAA